MNINFKKIFWAVIAVLILHSCSSKERSVDLVIMHTTDIHGSFFPYDFIYDKKPSGSLAQIYTIVKHERANNKNVVLLDNGDILQGQPSAYYPNFIDTTKTHLVARIQNFMNYDAATVGNHDIEAGHAVFDKFYSECNFPILAANAVHESDGKPYFEPYTIINKDGVRIAVLGLITPAIPQWLPYNLWEGMKFLDMQETAQYWIKEIQEKEKPHIIIGLFHSGYDAKPEHEKQNCAENASFFVAKNVVGFDAVMYGHDHLNRCELIRNINDQPVYIISTENAGRFVSKLEIKIKLKGDKVSEKKLSATLINTKNYEADSTFISEFQSDFDSVKNFVSQPIGEFSQTISSFDAFFGPSKFTDLIHRIQLDITKADISFTAPLSFNTTINKGEIYVRDMFKLYKYENLLYTMSLTGKEIKDYLEYSYSLWTNTMTGPNDNILLLKEEEDTRRGKLKHPFFNFDSAAGIVYTVDVTKPVGEKIDIKHLYSGEAFDFNKTYKVAINSYRGNGGGGHLTLGAKIPKEELSDRILSSTTHDLRLFLMQWIKENKLITPQFLLNSKEWSFIPEQLVKPAIERDYKLLFNN